MHRDGSHKIGPSSEKFFVALLPEHLGHRQSKPIARRLFRLEHPIAKFSCIGAQGVGLVEVESRILTTRAFVAVAADRGHDRGTSKTSRSAKEGQFSATICTEPKIIDRVGHLVAASEAARREQETRQIRAKTAG
jgi:hypothetical protein